MEPYTTAELLVPGAVEQARVVQLMSPPVSSAVVVVVAAEVLTGTSWAVTKVMRANKVSKKTLR